VDTDQLFAFLQVAQPEEYEKLGLTDYRDRTNMARQKFLARLRGETSRREEIDVLSTDPSFQNATQYSDHHNARIEHEKALKRVTTAMFKDDAQFFKRFQPNDAFRQWLTETVFGMTYEESSAPPFHGVTTAG
jgi:hypothetical protein